MRALIRQRVRFRMENKTEKKKCLRLIPKRIKPWPKFVVFIEAAWGECREESGLYYFWADRYYLEVAEDCDFNKGVNYTYDGNDNVVSRLDAWVNDYERIVVIGRNMAQIIVLLQASSRFQSLGYKCAWYFSANGRVYIRLENGKKSITFCDIRNWLPGELPEIGKWAGVKVEPVNRYWPDEEIPHDYHIHALTAVSASFYKYMEWVKSNKIGGFTFSLSSLAFTYFSRLPESRKLMHPRSDWLGNLEKKAHFGGFCKAHKTGAFRTGLFYLLDCNGLYGTVLRDEKLPFRHITSNFHPVDGDIDRAASRGDYIVQGVYQINDGFLPQRRGRWIDWTKGPVECYLPGPEFRWVKEHGKILEIKSIHVYETRKLGETISNTFLTKKAESISKGEKYEARMWKLLHNSLYGKFSQRFGKVHVFTAREGEPEGEEYCIDGETGSVWKIIIFCGTKIVQTEDGFGDTFFPSISAFITSHARVRLWRLCMAAGWENVLYNDTDSLLVNFWGYDRLRQWINPDTPGMVKVEECSRGCEILGEKRYRIGSTYKDGTEPNVYKVSADGFVVWAEKISLVDKAKAEAGAVSVRMRFKKTWAEEVRGLVQEYYYNGDENST